MAFKHFLLASVVALWPLSFAGAQNRNPLAGDASSTSVTATGGTTPATLADTVPLSILHFGRFTCDGQPHAYNAVTAQAAANAGRKISLPAGRCRLNATVHFVNGTEFIGQGRPGQYQFQPSAGTTLDFIDVPAGTDGIDSGGALIQMARIADLQIERATGAGINMQCVYCTLERVSSAYNGGKGVVLDKTYLTTVDQLFVELNGDKGFSATAQGVTGCFDASTGCYTTLLISNSEADHNTGDGWFISNYHTASFLNTGADHNNYGLNVEYSNIALNGFDAEASVLSGIRSFSSRVQINTSNGAGNNTSNTAGEANFLIAMGGSQVVINSSMDHALSTPYSLSATNNSNILMVDNNSQWLGGFNATDTSFIGDMRGIITLKPTSSLSFNGTGSGNYALYGDTSSTILNVATGGTLRFRSNNVDKMTLDGSGNLITNGSGTVGGTLQISGVSGTDRLLKFSSLGIARFGWDLNTTAESGSNVGSDLALVRYTDAGSVIDIPLTVTRSTGVVTMGDGLKLTSAPNVSVLPTGNALTTYTGLNIQASSNAANTAREFLLSCGLTVNNSNGTGPQEGNVCAYLGVVANPGAGYVWSLNTLVTMASGYNSSAQGYELDFNNNSGTDYGDTAGSNGLTQPVAYGLTIAGASTNRATSAILIIGNTTGGNPMWNRGIVFANNTINQVAIADYTHSPIVLEARGVHTTILDASNATTTNAAIWPLGAPVYWGSTSGPKIFTGSSGSTISVGGSNAIGSGTESVILGAHNSAGGNNNITMGDGAWDKNRARSETFASGPVTGTAGSSQVVRAAPWLRTGDTSPHNLVVDGTSTNSTTNCLNLTDNTVLAIDARVVARDTTTGNAATWESRGVVITRGSGAATTALAGSPTFTAGQTVGGLGGTVVWAPVDTTNGCVPIRVTAASSNTTDWVAYISALDLQ